MELELKRNRGSASGLDGLSMHFAFQVHGAESGDSIADISRYNQERTGGAIEFEARPPLRAKALEIGVKLAILCAARAAKTVKERDSVELACDLHDLQIQFSERESIHRQVGCFVNLDRLLVINGRNTRLNRAFVAARDMPD